MASDSESSQPGKKLKLESIHEWKKIIDVPHNKHTIFGPIRNDTIRHAKRTIYDEGQYRLVATLTFMFDKEEDQEEDHQVEVKLEASKPPEELSYSLNIKKKSVSPGGTWINVIHYNQKKLDTADWKNNEVKSKFGTAVMRNFHATNLYFAPEVTFSKPCWRVKITKKVKMEF